MLLYPPDLLKCYLYLWKPAGTKLLDLITFSPTVVTRTQNTCIHVCQIIRSKTSLTCIITFVHIELTISFLIGQKCTLNF